jgi:benzylsuccinate CoA-transferase BbsE subunit
MLSNCRALDLTDENGYLCGKILGDLGVDVIKVERPGGDPGRNRGPFRHDIPDSEKSLYWFAYNTNKRGITLNIENIQGQEILKQLIKGADFMVESFPPGYLDQMGLGYSTVREINRRIIMVSITPFGQDGPYKDFAASDLITMAMSGLHYQTGDPEGPPFNIGLPQACMHAGADAAVGALIAYYHREATGSGQFVDISMQQSVAMFLANAIPFWEINRTILERSGQFRAGVSSTTLQRQVWKCKDGHIFFILIPGKTGARAYRALLDWMASEGMDTRDMEKIDWENMDMATIKQETVDQMTSPIRNFFLAHTKKEILTEALARNISLCPLSSMSDLLDDSHLRSRNFWMELPYDDSGNLIPYPREFVKSSETSPGTRFRAPKIGEHNQQIFKEMGISGPTLITLKEAGII